MSKSRVATVPIPQHESERLAELHGLNLLDTASEQRFDRYTSLVADVFGFPIVLVTLVDRERQWFKSACGLALRETSRDVSFCAHAINYDGVMVVPDTRADPRFADNPLVTGHPHIRFYAGAIVHGPNGLPLGTLCVIDRVPRDFDDGDRARLQRFSELVEAEIRHSNDLDTVRTSVEFTAYADALTGLPNRRLLIDRLEKLIEIAEDVGRGVAVIVYNVSGLRMINQSFGTVVGNELLVQVGDRLHACCPLGGTVARLQGDEFALVFQTQEDNDGIKDVTDATRDSLDRPYVSQGREFYLGMRVGGSVFPRHGDAPGALIDRAAAAIRFSGEWRPGVIRFFDNKELLGISERLEIESRLRAAIGRDAFHLVYQPIISLRDGVLAGVEALLRWKDEELGIVGPDRFIPIAEQSGLIVPIGHWVQKEAFRQTRLWLEESSLRIPVSVNVAAAELLQPAFARDLLARLEEEGLPADLVGLELTEFSMVSDSDVVDRNMADLRDGGIQLIIDDFGTGYSSLAYLLRMPIRSLKIDRSFVDGIPERRNAVALTRMIIGMAAALELGTVGEGIETSLQLGFLRDAGCRYAQGYLISPPVQPDDIPSLCMRSLV